MGGEQVALPQVESIQRGQRGKWEKDKVDD